MAMTPSDTAAHNRSAPSTSTTHPGRARRGAGIPGGKDGGFTRSSMTAVSVSQGGKETEALESTGVGEHRRWRARQKL